MAPAARVSICHRNLGPSPGRLSWFEAAGSFRQYRISSAIIALFAGRYRVSKRKRILAEQFNAVPDEEDWEPRYNVAPTQSVPVVRQHPKEPVQHLSLSRWALIPSWMKDSSGAARMINARSETARTQPAFRDASNRAVASFPQKEFMNGKRQERPGSPSALKSTTASYFICGIVGALEKPDRRVDRDMCDSHDRG